MGYNDGIASKEETREITLHYLKIIQEEYEKNDSGRIQGYFLLSENGDVISKKELRKIQVREKDEEFPSYLGRSMCKDPDPHRRALVNMLLSYQIHNELMTELKKYNFKKINIFLTHIYEYRYCKDRLFKLRKTEYGIPLLEVNIKW